MSFALADLDLCFEGVIPSIIATTAADGSPNIAYLSQVVRVDERHVAISNQFFAKTSANIRANPHASLLLVDGVSGQQFQLQVLWTRSLDRGEVFERMARDLAASSAQVGMDHVMKLRGVDVFEVRHIQRCPGPEIPPQAVRPAALGMTELADILCEVASQSRIEDIVDVVLRSACAIGGTSHALLAISEPSRSALITAGSCGYEEPGTGSELPLAGGLIAEACAARRPLKINDVSRLQRLTGAVASQLEDEARTIPVPSLRGVMSQIAAPLVVGDRVIGVLFVESERRLAFDAPRTAAMWALASQAAAMVAFVEAERSHGGGAVESRVSQPAGPEIRITSHGFDDSVFINDEYVIKGLAGRLLVYLVERASQEGRADFTNREIRLNPALRLPEFKDNLETRLLLLQRRLDERNLPVRLRRSERGRMRLELQGRARVTRLP